MTTILKLGATMQTCPIAWQNFFDKECDFGPKDLVGDVKDIFINHRLKKYRGKLVVGKGSLKVKFDSEKDLTLFLLKWS